jgi:hypothetical protein
MAEDVDQPQRPRVEPEIIPPGRTGRQPDWRESSWREGPFGQSYTARRIYVGRIGPFGVALAMLAIAAIIAFITIAVLGAVLIWIPVFVAILVIGALFRIFRGFRAG